MCKHRYKFFAAVHIFLIKDRSVLLQRRFNTGFGDGKFSLPSGHIEKNEEVKSAAIRELSEELDIKVYSDDLEITNLIQREASMGTWIDFYLVAKKWEGDIVNAEPNKCDKLEWFSFNKLPKNTLPYIKKAIHNYTKNIIFDTCGFKK
jgi:8-oxo-dGTP diphosphatase